MCARDAVCVCACVCRGRGLGPCRSSSSPSNETNKNGGKADIDLPIRDKEPAYQLDMFMRAFYMPCYVFFVGIMFLLHSTEYYDEMR